MGFGRKKTTNWPSNTLLNFVTGEFSLVIPRVCHPHPHPTPFYPASAPTHTPTPSHPAPRTTTTTPLPRHPHEVCLIASVYCTNSHYAILYRIAPCSRDCIPRVSCFLILQLLPCKMNFVGLYWPFCNNTNGKFAQCLFYHNNNKKSR